MSTEMTKTETDEPTAGNAEMIEASRILSMSSIVPPEYQGAKNRGNCFIALDLANRMGLSPLQVMQSLYVVHGKPAFSAQFMIAAFNACGRFGPIRYKIDDPEKPTSCYAYCYEKATGEKIVGETITLEMAKAEGWLGKSGSKWKTMPGQMFRYRSATFLIRATAPEIALGFSTSDELPDITDSRPPAREQALEQVQAARGAAPTGDPDAPLPFLAAISGAASDVEVIDALAQADDSTELTQEQKDAVAEAAKAKLDDIREFDNAEA